MDDVKKDLKTLDLINAGREVELPKDVAEKIKLIMQDAIDELNKENPLNICLTGDGNLKQKYGIIGHTFDNKNDIVLLQANVTTFEKTDKGMTYLYHPAHKFPRPTSNQPK